MKLKYSAQDEVPEALREHYVEVDTQTDDGQPTRVFVHRELVEGEWESGERIAGLKSALAKERQNSRNAQRRLEELEKAPKSDDELQAARDEAKRAKEEANGLRLNSAATEAIAAAQGNTALLQSVVEARLGVDAEGKTYVRAVTGGAALLNPDGSEMSPTQFVESLRADERYQGAFKAKTPGGGGGAPPNPGGKGDQTVLRMPTNARRGAMTAKQKVDFIKTHGQAKFLALPL